ncbi:hypothetical protein [Plantactinospora sp. CA-290183]|uniref:hypothetical protein n=1 Tax=Plantactinospora sp. CA-290183 TaxID=3240006 RepID=UPI003D8E4C2F
MKLWTRWRTRRRERVAAEAERAARERDAAEAEATRRRLLELASRQPHGSDSGPERADWTWNGPTLVHGLPLLTHGQRRQYHATSC